MTGFKQEERNLAFLRTQYQFNIDKLKQILKPSLDYSKDFIPLFKLIFLSDFKNRTDHIKCLLEHVVSYFPEKSKFLTEPYIRDDSNQGYSLLEMMVMLENQGDVIQLVAEYVEKLKKGNSKFSLMERIIPLAKYESAIKSLIPLIKLHREEELNTVNYYGWVQKPKTLLMNAIIFNHDLETIKHLIDLGCDPSVVSYYDDDDNLSKMTPMELVIGLHASKEKKKALIDVLSIKDRNKFLGLCCHQGKSLLMRAANIKNTESIELLLEYPEVGDSINVQESLGDSALTNAVLLNQDGTVAQVETSKTIIRILLEKGADAYVKDKSGRTLLMLAASSGPTISVFDFIFECLCQTEEKPKLIQLLNQQDENGFTFLYYLLSRKQNSGVKESIEKIIAYGGEELTIFSALTKNHRTALDVAKEKYKEKNSDTGEILELIERHTPANEAQQKIMHLKNACHLLGFNSDKSDINALNLKTHDKMDVKAEGFEDKFTLPLLIEALTKYINSAPEELKDFNEIKEAFELTQKAYFEKKEIDTDLLFEQYKKNKMVIIPSGWEEHSITLGLYDGKLIVSNRGEFEHSDGGVTVFELNESFINQFKSDDPDTKAVFSKWISSISKDFSSKDAPTLIRTLSQCVILPNITSLRTLNLTKEDSCLELKKEYFKEDGTPKSHPILVQEWDKYLEKEKLTLYYKIFGSGNKETIIDMPIERFLTNATELKEKSVIDGQVNEDESIFSPTIPHQAPIFSFPLKKQSHGTCSFVNKKSIIQAMLYFVYLRTLKEHSEAMEKARKGYKNFTETMRDQFTDQLLKELSNPEKVDVNLLILSKQLDANKRTKEQRIVRQYKIISHIIHKNKNENKEVYGKFISKFIKPFTQASYCTREKRLESLVSAFNLLFEEDFFNDELIKAVQKLNENQMTQFVQLLQYLKHNHMVKKEVVLGLLNIDDALENCTKLLDFKNELSTRENQNKYGGDYTASVEQFVKKSIELLTASNYIEGKVKQKLESEAEKSFKHRHWSFRLFLDILAIIGTFGFIYVYNQCKHHRYMLFSGEKTNRQTVFENYFSKSASA